MAKKPKVNGTPGKAKTNSGASKETKPATPEPVKETAVKSTENDAYRCQLFRG